MCLHNLQQPAQNEQCRQLTSFQYISRRHPRFFHVNLVLDVYFFCISVLVENSKHFRKFATALLQTSAVSLFKKSPGNPRQLEPGFYLKKVVHCLILNVTLLHLRNYKKNLHNIKHFFKFAPDTRLHIFFTSKNIYKYTLHRQKKSCTPKYLVGPPFALIMERLCCGIIPVYAMSQHLFPSRVAYIFGQDFILVTGESNPSFSLFL